MEASKIYLGPIAEFPIKISIIPIIIIYQK